MTSEWSTTKASRSTSNGNGGVCIAYTQPTVMHRPSMHWKLQNKECIHSSHYEVSWDEQWEFGETCEEVFDSLWHTRTDRENEDTLKLKVFPFALCDWAKHWLMSLPAGSIRNYNKKKWTSFTQLRRSRCWEEIGRTKAKSWGVALWVLWEVWGTRSGLLQTWTTLERADREFLERNIDDGALSVECMWCGKHQKHIP